MERTPYAIHSTEASPVSIDFRHVNKFLSIRLAIVMSSLDLFCGGRTQKHSWLYCPLAATSDPAINHMTELRMTNLVKAKASLVFKPLFQYSNDREQLRAVLRYNIL
jgi:hypothetical protein